MLLGTFGGFTASLARPDAVSADEHTRSRFVAVAPSRLLDTRLAGPRLAAESVVTVPVGGRAGVPTAGVTAVAVNLTATDVEQAGFLTVYPAGADRPTTSNLNVVPGDTRANLAVTAIGSDDAISVYVGPSAHVVVDIAGYWLAHDGPTTAGRFVPVTPVRALDTRFGVGATPGPRSRGSVVRVPIAGASGVPASGVASAAVLSVTAVETGAGFVSVVPSDVTSPTTSTVNVGNAGVRANLSITQLGPDGSVNVVTQAGGHLLVDVLGYITGSSAPSGTDGLFVPLSVPQRMLDTRPRTDGTRLASGQSLSLRVGGRHGIPLNASAVLGNVTAVAPVRPGFGTVWATGISQPTTSNLNVEYAAQVVPVAAVSRLSDGRMDIFQSVAADVIVDAAGWFTPSGSVATGTASAPFATMGPSDQPAEELYDDLGYQLSEVAVPGHAAPSLPAGSGTGRRLVYSGAEQRAWAVDEGERVVRSWRVSGSEVPEFNERRGTYRVFRRDRIIAAANAYPANLHWFVGFQLTPRGNTIGFHAIPITYAGVAVQAVSELGTRQSGGCIRTAPLDAQFVWAFAGIGTTVVVM